LRLLRIKQWVKNLFVIAPLIFSKRFFDCSALLMSFFAVAAFCVASSAVYVLNDIRDAPLDRLHPKKRNRPIASNRVGVRSAYVIFSILLCVSILMATQLGPQFLTCVVVYLTLNVFYTLKGKNVVLIDVFCIAAGFALRVMGGSYAIRVVPSGWLITSTFFLSLFLGFSKRKAELVSLNGEDCAGRPSLQFYDLNLLTNVIVSTGTGAIVFYTLYTLDVRTVQQFGTDKLYLTVPFVCYGVFRYMFLSMRRGEEDPTDVLTKDKLLWLAIGLWFFSVMMILYLGR
jgi:decaprenyl-phosphate phosphoribosyltransferase